MKASSDVLRPIPLLATFFCSLAMAAAHPGPPGHHHPDGIDEFDESAAMPETGRAPSPTDLGGILVLGGVAACLGYALFQKDGGIWTDVTSRH